MFRSGMPYTALTLPPTGSTLARGQRPRSVLVVEPARARQGLGQRWAQRVDNGRVIGLEVHEQFGEPWVTRFAGIARHHPGAGVADGSDGGGKQLLARGMLPELIVVDLSHVRIYLYAIGLESADQENPGPVRAERGKHHGIPVHDGGGTARVAHVARHLAQVRGVGRAIRMGSRAMAVTV